MRPLLGDLEREGSVGQDDMKMFVRYVLETGPEDTPEEMGELLSRTAAGGEMMTNLTTRSRSRAPKPSARFTATAP